MYLYESCLSFAFDKTDTITNNLYIE
ncbi:mCG142288 [Mus musculus]|nr:mCG142288 [Mus musculus]